MKTLYRFWAVWLCGLLALGFVEFSRLDIRFSASFYTPEEGFFLAGVPIVEFIYRGIPLLAKLLSVILAGLLLLGLLPRFPGLRRWRPQALYLALALSLGPGLMVNAILKDHWGRARPIDTREFGGTKEFTPAFQLSDQCERNCSFVSGHASLGFFFCALALLARRRRPLWFLSAVGIGALVGLARIVQGKHFLSDVVFSFFAVYFCAKLLHYLLLNSASPLAAVQTLIHPRTPLHDYPTRAPD